MKKARLSILSYRILLTGGIAFSLLFLISCFSSAIDPTVIYGATYFALGFPVFFTAMIIWCIIALYLFPKKGWIFLLLLLPAEKNIRTGFGFSSKKAFNYTKPNDHLRILSWNVNEFIHGRSSDINWKNKQDQMVQFIKQSDADVLCFQDFVPVPYTTNGTLIDYITDSLKYPYHFFSRDGGYHGTIIFSRSPITETGRVKYKEKAYPESLAYATISFRGKQMRVYNTHLQSMYLHKSVISAGNTRNLQYVKEDTGFLFHSNRIERLEYFDRIHTSQARTIKATMNESRVPYIFCADLNAVPASYVYGMLQKNLKDAFIEQGSGLGGTYLSSIPTLRIDVLLTSKQFNTSQYYSPALKLSDHYPILADLNLGN